MGTALDLDPAAAPSDRLERATLRLINQISYLAGSRSHSRDAKAFTGIDLAPSDLRLLELLSGRPPVATSTLASMMRIDLAQASRQTKQLAAAGHLHRFADPTDRRRTLVELTEPTAALLDEWLLSWSLAYLNPLPEWDEADVADLAEWIELAHQLLSQALPHSPDTWARERWDQLAGDRYEPAMRTFVAEIVGLVSWVGQSGGFADLLEGINSPVNALGFSTLQIIDRHDLLSVAEVAERLGVDPSQASKRLRQLSDLKLVDRAVDGFDRRSNLIRLSRKGERMLAKVYQFQYEGFALLFEELDPVKVERWGLLMETYTEALLGPSTTTPSGRSVSVN